MESLYRKLFKYQERGDHTPLENFLTEAFSDLANRLEPRDQRGLIRDALLGGHASDNFKPLLEQSPKLSWDTQLPIPAIETRNKRRPDLVVWRNDRPFLVIKAKVRADFTPKQLENYGQWLYRESYGTGALIVLTHESPPPPEFDSLDSGAYSLCLRSVCRWFAVDQWDNFKGATIRLLEQVTARR
ncbi:MAG: hypothetical protein ACLQDV_17205 [Candidatus Binataceae bacterium]